ncbi:methyl-accepting chemotaxis protein [Sphingomonas lacusdianchii]|uniref:methyl-accepting chemotaxis protein n=1 Tax=Sphingomonas lacusdianchii TaxID=2917992 RepID=UPI001F594B2B|nr:methyl-accepting chemotaxis protein [Sphingomonas sp. JXJ CY 53]
MLVVMAILLIGMVVGQIGSIRHAVELNQQSARIIRLSHVAEKGVIRVNSQMRGVLLTGNFDYLDTYYEGRAQFVQSMASLATLVDLPEQRALVQQAVAAQADWTRQFGDPLIALARRPGGRTQATDILVAAGPKVRVTYINRMIASLREIEERRIAEREDELYETMAHAFLALGTGGVCLLAIAVAMAWLLTRSIAIPLARLGDIVDRLTGRDFTVTVPVDQRRRRDEIGRIARSLEVFRVAGIENQRLEAEAQRLIEARASDAEDAARRVRIDAERDRATIRIIGAGLAAIARGDLTFRLSGGLSGDATVLKQDYDSALAQLGGLLGRVQKMVGAVDRDTRSIVFAGEQLTQRTVEQSAAIAIVGDRLTQVTALIDRNTTGVRRVAEVAQSTGDAAEQSRRTVAEAVRAMARIDESSEQIGAIAGLVRSIAEQTHLLALNAQMEAARAGAAGNGFAVVAREVSQLAARLRAASHDIAQSLASARACAIEGVDLVGTASGKLGLILRDVKEMSTLVTDLAGAAERQADEVQDVDARMRDIARVTERNAVAAGEAGETLARLLTGADALARSLAQFRIPDASDAMALPAAA